MKRVLAGILAAAALLAGCTSDADVASQNISRAADQFEILRRIVFVNGITDNYMLEIIGYCSITADVADGQLEVTCKDENDKFKKHYLGISDNVTYVAEQLEAADVSTGHYRVVFKPSTIVPNVDIE